MEPITTELRKLMTYTVDDFDLTRAVVDADRAEFERLCDQIDAVHEGLERENDRLRIELARTIGELDEMHKSGEISNKPTTYMHSGRSITDELREWWVRKFPVMDKELHKDFTAIADRIDAEHEDKVSYWQGASYKDGYDEGFASADDWLAQHEDAMAEHGWIRLPKDADGVPIHVGDVMVSPFGNVYEVKGILPDRYLVLKGDDWLTIKTAGSHHYHVTTVEDVLREFADAMSETHPMDVPARIAEYAAKLRLVEGEDA